MHVGELIARGIKEHAFKESSIRMTLDLSGRFAQQGGGFYDLLQGESDER